MAGEMPGIRPRQHGITGLIQAFVSIVTHGGFWEISDGMNKINTIEALFHSSCKSC